MNIKEAKREISNTIKLYLEKDSMGDYIVPVVRQRPVFLVGAPGIGKTAIMEQIASEMDIALVSYSMTHHTRQSAIGLPYLSEREYGGRKCTISEYSMSEIIASIYEVIAKSGKKEGILFLDEINCVSETLAPSMLLFLQYKRFGNEQVPKGWVVVTAGNPPQFNKSVKEFDVATLDRLKVLSIDADYTVWKEYASSAGLHPAILSFLDLHPDSFYKIMTTVDGKQYITARGWEDLSNALRGYERNHFEVTTALIMQYITEPQAARYFSAFYKLFLKYRSNYAIKRILNGTVSAEITDKAKKAQFDERLSVISLLKDGICDTFSQIIYNEEVLQKSVKILRAIKSRYTDDILQSMLSSQCEAIDEELKQKAAAGIDDSFKKRVLKGSKLLLQEYIELVGSTQKNKFKAIQNDFKKRAAAHENKIKDAGESLAHSFEFIRDCWKDGQEMVLYVTELTMNRFSRDYIARWGSPDYYKYNKALLVYDQEKELQKEIDALLGS